MKNDIVNNKDSKSLKSKNPNVFKIYKIIFPTMFKGAPLLFVISQITAIFHGTFWGIETLYRQKLFDKATELTQGQTALAAVILSLVALGLVNVITQLLNAIANFLPNILVDKCQAMLTIKIHDKISRLPAETFEDTEKLDDINKAENGKANAVWFTLISSLIITFYVPYFAFMGGYLFTLKPSLSWAILIVFIPTALTQLMRMKVFSKLEDAQAPIRRESDYYERCMVDREYFKETRLLGGFEYFRKLFLDTLKLLNKLSFKANIKTNLMELAVKLLTVGGYIGILYMMFIALMNREISVGAFAAVFSSIGLLYGIMEEVVCRHIGNMARQMGTIKNYLNFLALPEREGEDLEIPANSDITLEQVSFAYPKAEKEAVKDASLTIRNGETIAIVGENGSGKSTMIRLLTGLYQPTSGKVKYGDISTDRFSLKRLIAGTSAVFQKYCRYQMLLSDNISISQVEKEATEEELDRITRMAGFSKEDVSFTKGYDTMLSREFDGVDLSGGEWQRVAIARAFYRHHNFIILDEPTAAIDPFEETKVYNRFAELSRDKTAVIVTHRLGSVKLADRIVVMKEGEIAEVGTHNELLEKEGEYARMYKAQQKWYQDL